MSKLRQRPVTPLEVSRFIKEWHKNMKTYTSSAVSVGKMTKIKAEREMAVFLYIEKLALDDAAKNEGKLFTLKQTN